MISFLRREPVVCSAAMQAGLTGVFSFGLHWPDIVVGSLAILGQALFALVTRSQVTPTGKTGD